MRECAPSAAVLKPVFAKNVDLLAQGYGGLEFLYGFLACASLRGYYRIEQICGQALGSGIGACRRKQFEERSCAKDIEIVLIEMMIARKINSGVALATPSAIHAVNPALVERGPVCRIDRPAAMPKKHANLPKSGQRGNRQRGGKWTVNANPKEKWQNEKHYPGYASCERPCATTSGSCGDRFKILLACGVVLADGLCGRRDR